MPTRSGVPIGFMNVAIARSAAAHEAEEAARARENVALVEAIIDADDAAAAVHEDNRCLICLDAEKTCTLVYAQAERCAHAYCAPCISQEVQRTEQRAIHPLTGKMYKPFGGMRCTSGCGATVAPHFHDWGQYVGGLMADDSAPL